MDLGWTGPVEHAVVEHRGGSAERLLGGLEDEHHGTGEPVAQARQNLRDTNSHRGVQIVSTHVGQLRAAPHLLIRRYRVHVRPVGDRPAGMRAGEHSHDPVPADARGDVEAGRAESPRDHARGAPLLTRDLRMPVDVPAQLDQVVVQPRRHGVHRVRVHRPGRRTAPGVCCPGRRQPGSHHAGGGATEHGPPADGAIS
jgi:hypothetical protein